jgi:hypothetical protein
MITDREPSSPVLVTTIHGPMFLYFGEGLPVVLCWHIDISTRSFTWIFNSKNTTSEQACSEPSFREAVRESRARLRMIVFQNRFLELGNPSQCSLDLQKWTLETSFAMIVCPSAVDGYCSDEWNGICGSKLKVNDFNYDYVQSHVKDINWSSPTYGTRLGIRKCIKNALFQK